MPAPIRSRRPTRATSTNGRSGRREAAGGKSLIPGVITHASNIVEHPELIAERIGRFAQAVGRENVIAGADCGFASFAATCEVHPSVVWVKLKALAEGARLASADCGGGRRTPARVRCSTPRQSAAPFLRFARHGNAGSETYDVVVIGGGHAGCEAAAAAARLGRAHGAADASARDDRRDVVQPGDRRARQGASGARDRRARRRHGRGRSTAPASSSAC